MRPVLLTLVCSKRNWICPCTGTVALIAQQKGPLRFNSNEYTLSLPVTVPIAHQVSYFSRSGAVPVPVCKTSTENRKGPSFFTLILTRLLTVVELVIPIQKDVGSICALDRGSSLGSALVVKSWFRSFTNRSRAFFSAAPQLR